MSPHLALEDGDALDPLGDQVQIPRAAGLEAVLVRRDPALHQEDIGGEV
jgi:hypothetical protein